MCVEMPDQDTSSPEIKTHVWNTQYWCFYNCASWGARTLYKNLSKISKQHHFIPCFHWSYFLLLVWRNCLHRETSSCKKTLVHFLHIHCCFIDSFQPAVIQKNHDSSRLIQIDFGCLSKSLLAQHKQHKLWMYR